MHYLSFKCIKGKSKAQKRIKRRLWFINQILSEEFSMIQDKRISLM